MNKKEEVKFPTIWAGGLGLFFPRPDESHQQLAIGVRAGRECGTRVLLSVKLLPYVPSMSDTDHYFQWKVF